MQPANTATIISASDALPANKRQTAPNTPASTSKRHIASELLKQTDRSDPLFDNNRTRVTAAGRPLLAAAQHAHEIRDDLTLEQILDMIVAIATIHGDTGYTEPILQTALDGLRPRPARHPHRAARQAG